MKLAIYENHENQVNLTSVTFERETNSIIFHKLIIVLHNNLKHAIKMLRAMFKGLVVTPLKVNSFFVYMHFS